MKKNHKIDVYLDVLRVDSKISSHFVCKIPSVLGVFANRVCEVIFERSLSGSLMHVIKMKINDDEVYEL